MYHLLFIVPHMLLMLQEAKSNCLACHGLLGAGVSSMCHVQHTYTEEQWYCHQ